MRIIILLFTLLAQKGIAQCFYQSVSQDEILDEKTIIEDYDTINMHLNFAEDLGKQYLFEISPVFDVYNDGNSQNAYFTNSKDCSQCIEKYAHNPFGYIFIGKNLLYKNIDSENITNKEMIVYFHELGHSFYHYYINNKLNKKAQDILTIRDKELIADYIAGFGLNKYLENEDNLTLLEKRGVLDNYIEEVFKSGDIQFNNPQHHGTKSERTNAFFKGFNDAEFSETFKNLISDIFNYITSIAPIKITIKK